MEVRVPDSHAIVEDEARRLIPSLRVLIYNIYREFRADEPAALAEHIDRFHDLEDDLGLWVNDLSESCPPSARILHSLFERVQTTLRRLQEEGHVYLTQLQDVGDWLRGDVGPALEEHLGEFTALVAEVTVHGAPHRQE